MSNSLQNKVVLITGASSGIGAGAAVRLARHGCRLALSGRNMHNLQLTAKQCECDHKIVLLQADITSETDVNKMVQSVVRTFGQLDVLVNCAGILGDSNIWNCDIAKYDEMMRVNLRGPLLVCKAAVPHLVRSKGNIVNVSSISGMRPMQGVMFYCLSKAALDQMTRLLAAELAPNGVRVNSVNPGVVKTNMHIRSGFTEERYKQYLEDAKLMHPIGRYGEVEDVAQAIAFLASDDASFITGVIMPVDGGRLCVTPRSSGNQSTLPAKL